MSDTIDKVADNATLQLAIRKLRDETVVALETRIAALESQLALFTPHGLTLKSPDGSHQVVLKADDHGAGVWVTEGNDTEANHAVAIFTGYGEKRAIVGAWKGHDHNNPTRGLDAALLVSDSGHLQLADKDSVISQYHAHDLSR